MKLQQRTLLSYAIGSVLGVGGVAMAQESGQRPSVLEEVVVTAEKREQTVQEVPVAVSAYTSQRRDVLGVNTIEDFARITPSLSYTNNDRLSIRGFGRLTNNIGTDPSVALYSDGIFSTSMERTPRHLRCSSTAPRSCAVRRARSTAAIPSAAPST